MSDSDHLFKNPRYVKVAFTVVAFILVLIFAPRLDGPRVIFGVEFTTKTGGSGLTNFGFFLLVTVPALTYIITSLVIKLLHGKKNRDK